MEQQLQLPENSENLNKLNINKKLSYRLETGRPLCSCVRGKEIVWGHRASGKKSVLSQSEVNRNRLLSPCLMEQKNRAVARKPRDAAAVLFGVKFADNIHYKLKSSQASKARLQSSKHTDAKPNLMQNGHSRSFKVTCFGVSGKAIRE